MIKPLVLVGLRASGKSTLGAALARRTGLAIVDMDTLVLPSVQGFVQKYGWQAFREEETHLLHQHAKSPCILASGGGIVLAPENREFLQKNCYVVYLHVKPEVLAIRLEKNGQSANRPPLPGAASSIPEECARQYAERDALYRACTSYILENGDIDEHTALNLLAEWAENCLPQVGVSYLSQPLFDEKNTLLADAYTEEIFPAATQPNSLAGGGERGFGGEGGEPHFCKKWGSPPLVDKGNKRPAEGIGAALPRRNDRMPCLSARRQGGRWAAQTPEGGLSLVSDEPHFCKKWGSPPLPQFPHHPPSLLLTGASTSALDVGHYLAAKGELGEWSGCLVASQSAGRGQMRRGWASPVGNMYCALRLPREGVFATEYAAPAFGGLIAKAFRQMGVKVKVKWPNDILVDIGGVLHKAGGILLEEKRGILLAGFGLNLVSAPPERALREDCAYPAGTFMAMLHTNPSLLGLFLPAPLGWGKLLVRTLFFLYHTQSKGEEGWWATLLAPFLTAPVSEFLAK